MVTVIDGRIATIDEVPRNGTFLFRVESRETGVEREAILVRTASGVAAWLNYCQHYTHIKLDKGGGAPIRNGEILCTNHGAMFEVDTGRCTYGPCEGAYLNDLDVSVEDGVIHLDDPAYSYVGVGPVDMDDGHDLSSNSNLEF